MSAPVRWSHASLERALRLALRERARIRHAHLTQDSAQVTWTDNGPAHVVLDSFSVGLLRGVLHELMHVVLDDFLQPFGDEMVEDAIEAWEESLTDRIMASPARKRWWRTAIMERMGRR